MDTFVPGERVTCYDDPLTVGVVERIEDQFTVWVRFPIPGHPGKTDIVDVDPGDLRREIVDV